MLVAIDGSLCELPTVFVFDGKRAKRVDSRPDDALWVGTQESVSDPSDAIVRAKLEGTDVDLSVPAKYVRAARTLGEPDPWEIVSLTAKVRWVSEVAQSVCNAVRDADVAYHVDVFAPTSALFDLLRPWRVDPKITESDDPHARTCLPDAGGWVCPPRYDRFGTRTGRMTVAEGPMVLNVRHATRDLFRPVDDGHAFVCFDFASFEARIALALAGRTVGVTDDPYERIREMSRSQSRDDAKAATFSALYSDPGSPAKDVRATAVRRVFKLGELYGKLKKQRADRGSIRNLHGRRVQVDDDSLLYSSYVQSSGVDVAMLGFAQFLGKVDGLGIVPHFFLHDALYASVPLQAVADVSAIGAAGVSVAGLDMKFPIKASGESITL